MEEHGGCWAAIRWRHTTWERAAKCVLGLKVMGHCQVQGKEGGG